MCMFDSSDIYFETLNIMANCNFFIEFNGDGSDLIERARVGITKAGGNLKGDDQNGNFHITTSLGKIEGVYSIVLNQINIEISHKPMLVSCKRIETELQQLMN